MARPRTVLVVDDDPSIRLVIRRMLEASGFSVVAVGNGAAALEALEGDAPIGAAMVDVVLPRMRGCELVARLRAVVPDLPVVVMSGYARDDLEDNDLVGSDVFLNKPFARLHLVETLESLLSPPAEP